MVMPTVKRKALAHLCETHGVSQPCSYDGGAGRFYHEPQKGEAHLYRGEATGAWRGPVGTVLWAHESKFRADGPNQR